MFSFLGPFFTRRCFFFATEQNILKVCGTPKGWPKKQRKTRVFLVAPWFFCLLVSSWSPFVFIYLGSLLMCHSSWFSYFGVLSFFFLVVVLRFLFPSLSLLCFFTVDAVVSLARILSLCDKNPDQITACLRFGFWCFCFGACIFTLSLGPANNPYSAQRTTSQKWYLFTFSFALNNVLEYLILQCFLNINQNYPKMGPKKR